MLINKTQQKNISDAIAAVERNTNAELVTVLARQADDYRYIGFTWAALVALVSPGVLLMLPLWLDLQHIIFTQSITFTVPGDGSLDFEAIVRKLASYGYEGWFVVEAEQDPKVSPPLNMAIKGHKELMRVMKAVGYEVVQ